MLLEALSFLNPFWGGENMTVLHYGAIYILGSWVVLGFLIFKTDMFKID